jgi:hypothetical protein
MLFTKLRASTLTNTGSSNNMFNSQTTLPISQIMIRKKNRPKQVLSPPPPPSPPPTKNKMIWGAPFWNFFHILAEKIDGAQFANIRRDILSMIFNICSNLPCPDCTTHAVSYLKGINFNNILTKNDLKEMLFNFHNAVNVRKGIVLYSRNELNEKYSKGNFQNGLKTFLYFFQMRHNNIRLLNEDLHRRHIAKELELWFQKNISHFH